MKILDSQLVFVIGVELVCIGTAVLTAALVSPETQVSAAVAAGLTKAAGAMMVYSVVRGEGE